MNFGSFGNSQEDLDKGEVHFSDGIEYERTDLSSLETRKISETEYEELPNISKKGVKNLLDLKMLFLVIVAVSIIRRIVRIMNPENANSVYIFIAVILGILAIVTGLKVTKGIDLNSEVISGNVMRKDIRAYSRRRSKRMKFLVAVAFHDKKQFVMSIPCDYKTYKHIEVDSKVYICKNRVYAAE